MTSWKRNYNKQPTIGTPTQLSVRLNGLSLSYSVADRKYKPFCVLSYQINGTKYTHSLAVNAGGQRTTRTSRRRRPTCPIFIFIVVNPR